MRIIPGNTKVKIEIFRGLTLWDMLVGALAAIMLGLIVTSTLPYKIVFISLLLIVTALLLSRFDKEPNYMYLIHIIRYLGFKRRFDRSKTDEVLMDIADRGEYEVAMDELFPEEKPEEEHVETKAERKERLKAEKAERKADDKLLKSKTLTKEEEDAIWLKRANQSAAKKTSSKAKKEKKKVWDEMEELSAFTGIKDNLIEYGREYYGAVVEVPCVEFRFFSQFRRANAIENGLGSVIRSMRSDYCINLVKVERPVEYDSYLDLEYAKLDELKKSYEEGFFKEDELQARVAIVYDRIKELTELRESNKVVIPFYYLCFFDSDKNQLENSMDLVMDTLKLGEMNPKRLNDKELAVFLRYTNSLDFDEHSIDSVNPEEYATWAMPQTVEFSPRTTQVNGIATHNFRVVSYPTAVYDGWLASLLTYPSTKVVVKMQPMDSGKAINAIDKSLSELRAKVSSAKTDSEAIEAQTHLETLQLLLTSLQGDNETLLDCNIYVSGYDLIYTENNAKLENINYTSFRARVANMKKATKRAWAEAGFRLNNMEFNQHLAYIGSQVSGYDPMSNDGRGIPSNTIAASFPWVFPHVMDDDGVKFGASDGVPVFIDFFKRDSERVNSNMVIVGKSGSGKSFATKTLLTNLAADDAKIFILDPEDEYSELARNLNGKFINVANSQFGRLNPFHIITTLDDDEEAEASGSYATHLQFLEEFFKQILPDCDRDSLEYLNALVEHIYAAKGIGPHTDLSRLSPDDYPVFDDLYDEILREYQRTDNEYIRTMLRTLMNYISKFAMDGRNASIWNGPSTVTTEENFTVFNFQSLLANRNTTIANAQMLLVLKYIDNEIIKNRDYNEKYGLSRKVVVVIDEAHVFIDTKFPVALDFMFQLAKRIRKYNGMQIVITQNIKDFVGSEEIARKSTAIINACQYSFIFSLAPNDMDDLCKLYEKAGGINENEQEMIVQAPRGQAFTIMSPTSRTSFKITTPDNVRDMFQNRTYDNPYFTGVGGEENWASYIGDASEKREANLAANKKADKEEAADDEELLFNGVQFNEVSAEDYVEPEKPEEEAPAAKKPSLGDLDSFEIPELPENPMEFARQRAADVIAPLSAAAAATAASSSKTEEMLAELALKLGSDNMKDEIRRAVDDALEKALADRPAAVQTVAAPAFTAPAATGFTAETGFTADEDEESASLDFSSMGNFFADMEEESAAPSTSFSEPEEDDDEDSSVSLGSIFDFAGLDVDSVDDNELEAEMAVTGNPDEDDAEDSDDSFDIMSFFLQQSGEEEKTSEEADNDTTIEDFINASETVLDVTLEQLMSYNKRVKK